MSGTKEQFGIINVIKGRPGRHQEIGALENLKNKNHKNRQRGEQAKQHQ